MRLDRISLRDLADDPYILLDLPFSRDYFFGLFHTVGIEPRIVFRSRSQELIRGLVAHGHGFAIQNAISGSNITYDGASVAILPLDPQLTPTRITLLRHRQFPLRPAVQAFEDFLHETTPHRALPPQEEIERAFAAHKMKVVGPPLDVENL